MPSSIFIVDSSPAVRRMVEQISTPEGFEVVGFQDGPAALEAARRITPALIIADYHLAHMTFSGFCKEINKLDNLSDTDIISLINSADRPDENLLRGLGVKAFIKKPFQGDDLLDVIKSVQQKQGQANGKGLKRRIWPPVSSSTDADNDEEATAQVDLSDDEEDSALDHPMIGASSAPPPTSSKTEPEETMKGLFGQLLQSMTERAEQRLTDLLPGLLDTKLGTQVRPIIQRELDHRLGEILSNTHLATVIQPLLVQELPALLCKELTAAEPVIRQIVSDLAGPLIAERLTQTVRECTESLVRTHLSEAVREHVGSIDLVVKDEIRQATLKHAALVADDLVRAVAEQTVEQAVQRIVPELAERHIKAELARLTAEDDRGASA